MRLVNVEIQGFRGIERLELPLHERMNVVVGENAAGKTTVIEAIAIGLGAVLDYLPECKSINFKKGDIRTRFEEDPGGILVGLPGEESEEAHRSEPGSYRAWVDPFARVTLEATTGIVWDRHKRKDQTKLTAALLPRFHGRKALTQYLDPIIEAVHESGDAVLPIIAYYGTDRAVPKIPERRRNFNKALSRFSALDGALDAGFQFKEVFEWLIVQEDHERREKEQRRDFDYKLPILETVREAITRALPGCRNPRTELNPLRLMVDLDTEAGGMETLALNELSDGYRVMLALVMGLARRMAQANPQLDRKAIDAGGVVLIDEVDLHLHPQWQQRVLHDLQTTFPHIQFIVSTHSPQVLTTVKPESILILERNKGSLTAAAATSSYGAKSGRLLTEILGVEQQPPADVVEFTRLLNQYKELIHQDRGEESDALELRAKLHQLSPLEPELIAMDMEIRRRRVLSRTRGKQA